MITPAERVENPPTCRRCTTSGTAELAKQYKFFGMNYLEWRRGWDSHHCRLLKTKNLRDSDFLTILKIRTKALVETRIEHATGVGSIASGDHHARPNGRSRPRLHDDLDVASEKDQPPWWRPASASSRDMGRAAVSSTATFRAASTTLGFRRYCLAF